jgi:hypothetical protein
MSVLELFEIINLVGKVDKCTAESTEIYQVLDWDQR